MINPDVITKCQKIAEGKIEVKNLPKNFQLDIVLSNNRFYGDRFLDPNGKHMYKYNNTISYFYFNTKLNTEIELFFNKRNNSINATIYFKDYNKSFVRLSLKKLVHIINLLNG